MKNILIVSSSLRGGSNSLILSEAFAKGARQAGHQVELVSLKDKKIGFCIGCLRCQKTQKCVIEDDATEIREKMKQADVVVFATPIYYYSVCGSLKTLLDRMNPLFADEYRFKEVYLLATCADGSEDAISTAVEDIKGWVSCFERATFKGSFLVANVNSPKQILSKEDALEKVHQMGGNV